MHGYFVTETTENESPKESYRFGLEEETYKIVAANVYYGRLILPISNIILILYISSHMLGL